jgi:putative DNA primase/helicase
MTTAVPPSEALLYSPTSQRALLGSVLLNNQLLRGPLANLAVKDFFGGADQEIFRTMLRLNEDGQNFDALVVAESLKNSEYFCDDADCLLQIESLTDGVVPVGDRARWHCHNVQGLSRARQLYSLCEAFQRNSRGLTASPEVLIDNFRVQFDALESIAPQGQDRHIALTSISAEDLIKKEIKPREMLLDPILPAQGLVMTYSFRGTGKTMFCFGIAAAVASGGRFLKWEAPVAKKVLYVDGELPASTVQERLAMTLSTMGTSLRPDALRFITPDLQNRSMPDLATKEGQKLLEQHLEGVSLLILDNLSALCRDGKENEGEGWLPVQGWLLELRRRGITVLLLHHAGKNLSQRGTSRREDLLDAVISLKHPADYNPGEGLRCEVHFEKTRGLLSTGANPMEIQLKNGEWSFRDLADLKDRQAEELLASGMSIRDVAEELGISKSKVHRIKNRPNVGLQRGTVPGNPVSHGNGYQGQTINGKNYSFREV